MGPVRPTRAEVDLDAVAHNVRVVRDLVAPASVWVVVKADGYGHGAAAVGSAAIEAGAEALAVALVEEAEALRRADVRAPVVILSEAPAGAADRLVAADAQPAVYSRESIAEVAAAAARAGRTVPVHLKVDTGMHRVGVAPGAAADLAVAIDREPALALASVWTHLAVADVRDDPFTAEQLRRYDEACDAIEAAGVAIPRRHAANSAGAIAHPAARLDAVRLGIAAYGVSPGPALDGAVDLRPALRLVSAVSHVQRIGAGEAVSYGRRYRVEAETTVAVVPIGYADGVRRRLGAVDGEVLIGGRRCPIAGTVTMDQITVDCGPDARVERGDEVVLIGRQGDEEITAAEWARRLDTIGYEITCAIGPRVPRVHVRRSG